MIDLPIKLTLKLGFLEHLDLPHVDVVQWVDGLAGFLDVLPNAVRDPVKQTIHINLHAGDLAQSCVYY